MPSDETTGSRRKFYFMLTFWGEEFRQHFYSLLLPTLLAPDNIPVLKSRPGSKLVICTTWDDWKALEDRPLMRQLATYVEPLPLFIDYPTPGAPTQLHMSAAHQMAARRARTDGAVAGFLAPDLLCSNGLVRTAVEMIESGKKAVLCPALRFSLESALARIDGAGLLKPDEPATLPATFMGSVAANSLHPEILRYDFEDKEFDNYPIWSFWRVPGHDGLVLYTVSWALLLADYAAVLQYDDDMLNNDTIDSQYVWRNFGHLRETDQVAILNDSAQGTFISLTPNDAFKFSSPWALNLVCDFFGLSRITRARSINGFYNSAIMDPWRQWLYHIPITLHGDQIDSAYVQRQEETQRFMLAVTKSPSDYRKLRALLAADPSLNGGQQVPSQAVVDLFILVIKGHGLFRSVLSLALSIKSGQVSILHLLRRILHILSFGLIYYPGTRDRERLAASPD